MHHMIWTLVLITCCRWAGEVGETGGGGWLETEEARGREEPVRSGVVHAQDSEGGVHETAEDVHGPDEGHGARVVGQRWPGESELRYWTI